ncbi:hypothetical protein D3Y55_04300 [Mesorhizobium sp. DCY119]|nr:hypothetical protein D3Y55_04300 [Mesorhizobium sp. DCY119]
MRYANDSFRVVQQARIKNKQLDACLKSFHPIAKIDIAIRVRNFRTRGNTKRNATQKATFQGSRS